MQGIRRDTDYAVRTVLHLASLTADASVQVSDIAAQRGLPLYFARRIVARLGSAGILATTRGKGGGVRLGRPAAEISLLDVVRAMEGGVAMSPCADVPHSCPLAEACPVQRAWSETTRVLENHLASIRFDALARSGRHLAAHRRLATSLVALPPKPTTAVRGPGRRGSRGAAE